MSAKRSIIPIFIPHLGCPHDCVFCDQHSISGQAAPVTPDQVRVQIEAALDKAKGPCQAAFYGGSFTAIPAGEQEALLKAAEPFIKNGAVESIRVSTRPDAVDGQALSLLRAYGAATVELGCQSMDDDVLRLSARGHTARDTRWAAGFIKQEGFELILQMMTGLPGDTSEKSVDTAKELISLCPDGVRVYPTVVLRDTALYRMWRRGEYSPQTVEEAVELCARLLPLFDAARVPVIRMGLNPTERLQSADVAAGAYHPAFGELVRSRVYFKKARELLESERGSRQAVLVVARGETSAMTGVRRENALALEKEFSIKKLKILEGDIIRGEILLQ